MFKPFSAPVVITSDRLRSSRISEGDKPTSSKKAKFHEDEDDLNTPSASPPSSSIIFSHKPNNDDIKNREKLYPKRERTKTEKFEEFFTGFKKNSRAEESAESVSDSNEVEVTVDTIDGSTVSNKSDEKYHYLSNVSQGEILTNDIDQTTVDDVRSSSSALAVPEDVVSELTDNALIKDITVELEIIRDVSNKTPPPYLLESTKQSSESDDCESVIEDGVRLELVRIPKRLRGCLMRDNNQRSLDVDDDIPLSQIFGNSVGDGTGGLLRLGKDGNLKRPVGRPRKHPLVINKVKRPVGRPRKEHSQTDNNKASTNQQQKRKRGRPPSLFVPSAYYGAYSQSSFFEVDDDDERDPVSLLSFSFFFFMFELHEFAQFLWKL